MIQSNPIVYLQQFIGDRMLSLINIKYQVALTDSSLFKFETPPSEQMGHIAFACFPLAKILKKAPPKIATELVEQWESSPYFNQVMAVGPYVNFFIDSSWLAKNLLPFCEEDSDYGKSRKGEGKTMMLEYASPNTNKPLHLGHGRNIVLGTTLSNLLEFCGYKVIRTNLINDRGIHICKSMLAYQKWGNEESPQSCEKKGDRFVGDYYVLYAQKEKEMPALALEASAMLRDWEEGKSEVRALWKTMNAWVLKGFEITFQRFGATFDQVYFESETFEGGREIVLNALQNGVCLKEDNGAIAIDLEAQNLGKKILLRGDGTSVYMTQDIHTTLVKFSDYDLDGCLFVVGNEQDNHFRVLFAVLKQFGFEWADLCEHISYGMITLPEGKMKSREGTVIDLDGLMDEMKLLALEGLKERDTESNEPRETKELELVAEQIGLAAIKYFILKIGSAKNILFNPRESLSFDGATGPYLQYTHARIASVLKKAGAISPKLPDTYAWNEDENRILIRLAYFPSTILESADQRNPAVLAAYVYDLARIFNKFYFDNKILTAETDEIISARLHLAIAVKSILKKCLEIMGITPLKRM